MLSILTLFHFHCHYLFSSKPARPISSLGSNRIWCIWLCNGYRGESNSQRSKSYTWSGKTPGIATNTNLGSMDDGSMNFAESLTTISGWDSLWSYGMLPGWLTEGLGVMAAPRPNGSLPWHGLDSISRSRKDEVFAPWAVQRYGVKPVHRKVLIGSPALAKHQWTGESSNPWSKSYVSWLCRETFIFWAKVYIG